MTTEQKAAVLRSLRERLIEQKERFMRYLADLDLEYAGNAANEPDAAGVALGALETEKQIVSEIGEFQRLIEPLEDLYRAAYPRQEREIPPLRAALQSVQRQVLERLEHNEQPGLDSAEPAELAAPAESTESAAFVLASGRQLRSRDRGRSVFAEPPNPSTIDIST